MNKMTITLGLMFLWSIGHAQGPMTLQQCIDHALKHNPIIKNSQLAYQSSTIETKSAKAARLPMLNLNITNGLNLGRTIDPTSNAFITATSSFSSYNLNTGVTLYNFGRINNRIKQASYDQSAAREELRNTQQNLTLQVVAAYLNILLAQDQLGNAKKRMQNTQNQLQNTNKLIEAGTLPPNEKLQIEAQLAQDQQNIISFENNLTQNILQLKQLMALPPDHQLDIQRPQNISLPETDQLALRVKTIYAEAEKNRPAIKALQFRIQSAEASEKFAESQAYPSLTLNGRINTNFSSQAKIPQNIEFQPFESQVLIDGSPSTLTSFRPTPKGFNTINYIDQITENFGAGVAVGLQIPLYNNYRNKANIQRSKINLQTIINRLEIEKQTLRSEIERAIADVRTAAAQYQAVQKTQSALQTSYDNAKKRYQLGAINSFELNNLKNQLEQAKNNSIQRKYDYLFKLKIIDFYTGNTLYQL